MKATDIKKDARRFVMQEEDVIIEQSVVQEMTTLDGTKLIVKPAIGYRIRDIDGNYVTICETKAPVIEVLPVKSGNPFRQKGGRFGKKLESIQATPVIISEFNKNHDKAGRFDFAEGGLTESGSAIADVQSRMDAACAKRDAAQAALKEFDKNNPPHEDAYGNTMYPFERQELVAATRNHMHEFSRSLKEEASDNTYIGKKKLDFSKLDDEEIYELESLENTYGSDTRVNLGSELSMVKLSIYKDRERRGVPYDENSYSNNFTKDDVERGLELHNNMVNNQSKWNKMTPKAKEAYSSYQNFVSVESQAALGRYLGRTKGTKTMNEWRTIAGDHLDTWIYMSPTTSGLRAILPYSTGKEKISAKDYMSKATDTYKEYKQSADDDKAMFKTFETGTGNVTLYRYGSTDRNRMRANGTFFTGNKSYASTYSDRAWDSTALASDASQFRRYTLNLNGLKVKNATSTQDSYESIFQKDLFTKKVYCDDQRVKALWVGERKVHATYKADGYDLVSYKSAPLDNGLGSVNKSLGLSEYVSEVVIINRGVINGITPGSTVVQ